jgi:predicted permease
VARASRRRHEFAVRLSIGAGRSRLIRQLLTETLLLFFLGAAAGLAVARLGIDLLIGFFAVGRSPLRIDAHIDVRLIAFTAGVTLLTGILFGLGPAIAAIRTDAYPALKESESRVTTSRRRFSARRILAAAQVAFSLVLLVAAGLFIRTLVNLRSLKMGFHSERVVTLSVQPLGPAYQAPRLAALWSDLLVRVKALPGVRSASLSQLTPLGGRDRIVSVTVPGFETRSTLDTYVRANHVSEEYFETMRIPLAQGRVFGPRDALGTPKPAVLSEAAAKFYFAGRNPLGATLRFGTSPTSDGIYEIVGVVADAKHMSLREEAPRFVYLPLSHPRDRMNRLTLALRTDGDPTALMPVVRRQIDALGPTILVSEVMTLQQQVDATLVQERLLAMLSTFFGILALMLSAIGIYGTLSQIVIQRTREIGIRMALGANKRSLIWMILRGSLGVVVTGIAVGLPVAWATARPIEALLYGLRPTDLATIVLGTAVLLAAALLASYLPARRASRIDPIISLRYE